MTGHLRGTGVEATLNGISTSPHRFSTPITDRVSVTRVPVVLPISKKGTVEIHSVDKNVFVVTGNKK